MEREPIREFGVGLGGDTMEKTKEDLSWLTIFGGIEKEQLPLMMGCLNAFTKEYKKNEYISIENDDMKDIGVVLHGNVDMVKEDIWGNTTTLVRLGKDRVFGESFACSQDNHSMVTFRATSPTRILFMPFERVMHTCSHSCAFHQVLVENMVEQIARKNRELMEKVEVISQKTLRGKLLAYLSSEAQKAGSRYFEIPMGRVELADYLCADRSAVTRELSQMKKEGLLDYDHNTFSLSR